MIAALYTRKSTEQAGRDEVDGKGITTKTDRRRAGTRRRSLAKGGA